LAVLVDERSNGLAESHFADSPDKDAMSSEMRDRLCFAEKIGLGIDEKWQAARDPPIASIESFDA
jgi:hypothetical protein